MDPVCIFSWSSKCTLHLVLPIFFANKHIYHVAFMFKQISWSAQNPVAHDYLILTMTLILTLTTCWHIWEWRITNPGFCSDPTMKSDMGDRSFLCCSHKKAEIIQFHVLWTDQSTIYWMYLAISYRLNTANSPPSAVSSSHLWVVCLFVCLPGSVSWQANIETGMG